MQKRNDAANIRASRAMFCFLAACVIFAQPIFAQQDAPKGTTPANAATTAQQREMTPEEKAEKILADFTAWSQKYVAASASGASAVPGARTTAQDRAALEPAGVALAAQRRQVLAWLIEADPARALDQAVPLQVRRELPLAVTQYLEERVSGCGSFMVLSIDRRDPQTGALTGRIERSVRIGGKTYRAGVYGRRLGMTSKQSIPLHGIAIGRVMAVHESPVRELEAGESPDPKAPSGLATKQCPLCGADASAGIAADIGGALYYFDTQAHLKEYTDKVKEQEAIVGPSTNGPCQDPAWLLRQR
jgi:hypothetical protein